jgi:hypothetical protein
MRQLYWTSFITMLMLIALNIVSAPILQHFVVHQLPVHKTLYLDRNLSDGDTAIIISAALEWHVATNGLVTYDIIKLPRKNISINNSIVIVIVSPDLPDIIALDSATDGEETHLGYYENNVYIPYIGIIPTRIAPEEYRATIMHELGHSLGMKHTDELEGIGTLMYPNADFGARKITDEDLKAFCVIYHCDASKLHDQ